MHIYTPGEKTKITVESTQFSRERYLLPVSGLTDCVNVKSRDRRYFCLHKKITGLILDLVFQDCSLPSCL